MDLALEPHIPPSSFGISNYSDLYSNFCSCMLHHTVHTAAQVLGFMRSVQRGAGLPDIAVPMKTPMKTPMGLR